MGFDFSFENIVEANLVSFIVMMSIFAVILKKIHIGAVLDQQKNAIIDNINKSEKARTDSEETLMEVEGELKAMPDTANKMENEAKKSAEVIAEQIETDAQKQIKKTEQNAQRAMDSEAFYAKLSLSKNISLASLTLAKANLVQALEADTALHKKIINQCIDELDELKA